MGVLPKKEFWCYPAFIIFIQRMIAFFLQNDIRTSRTRLKGNWLWLVDFPAARRCLCWLPCLWYGAKFPAKLRNPLLLLSVNIYPLFTTNTITACFSAFNHHDRWWKVQSLYRVMINRLAKSIRWSKEQTTSDTASERIETGSELSCARILTLFFLKQHPAAASRIGSECTIQSRKADRKS